LTVRHDTNVTTLTINICAANLYVLIKIRKYPGGGLAVVEEVAACAQLLAVAGSVAVWD